MWASAMEAYTESGIAALVGQGLVLARVPSLGILMSSRATSLAESILLSSDTVSSAENHTSYS